MKKLTLNAETEVIEMAKRLAEEQGTSVSAMFGQFVRAMSAKSANGERKLGPLTRRATGLVKLPPGKSYKEVFEEALLEKYAR